MPLLILIDRIVMQVLHSSKILFICQGINFAVLLILIISRYQLVSSQVDASQLEARLKFPLGRFPVRS